MNWLRISFGVLALLCIAVQGHKILVLIVFPGPSHHVYIANFVEELVLQGHEVTSVACFSIAKKSINVTETIIKPDFDLSVFMSSDGDSIFDNAKINDFEYTRRLYLMGIGSTEYGLQNEKVQDFIENDNSHFDLILAEQFFQESFLMFAHKYKAPIITMCTPGHPDYLDRMMGLQTPWSHVPHVFSLYGEQMTLYQRTYNTLLSLFDVAYRELVYLPTMEEYARKYFKSFEKYGPLPTIKELEKNISVIFINAHRSMIPPRPYMPGIINIGGAHVRPPKELPADIKKYIDEAEHGVIYFSLGAFLQSSQMPRPKVQQILNAFRQLKQRVLWKWEDDKMENIPPNVMIKKWLPQSDILAHPNVLVFISHGGLFGSFEGAFRSVPMLYIPIYGDQHRNAIRATDNGYARILQFADITTESLLHSLNELLYNKRYMDSAKKISGLLKDNPNDLMEEFIFWTDYVIRHKGAPGLKSIAVNMSFFSYMLLDVLLLALLAIMLITFVIIKVFRRILRRKSATKANGSKQKKKLN